MFYHLLTKLSGICFNILNWILGGNLPPFGCVCIFVEEQGHYLVIESAKGQCTLPGGFIRWRETPAQTVQREGKEETGLDLRVGNVLSYYSKPSRRFDAMSGLVIILHAEVVGGELHSSVEGRPYWLTESEFRTKMSSFYRDILDDYLHHHAEHNKFIE